MYILGITPSNVELYVTAAIYGMIDTVGHCEGYATLKMYPWRGQWIVITVFLWTSHYLIQRFTKIIHSSCIVVQMYLIDCVNYNY